jgi:hypothetical protein
MWQRTVRCRLAALDIALLLLSSHSATQLCTACAGCVCVSLQWCVTSVNTTHVALANCARDCTLLPVASIPSHKLFVLLLYAVLACVNSAYRNRRAGIS